MYIRALKPRFSEFRVDLVLQSVNEESFVGHGNALCETLRDTQTPGCCALRPQTWAESLVKCNEEKLFSFASCHVVQRIFLRPCFLFTCESPLLLALQMRLCRSPENLDFVFCLNLHSFSRPPASPPDDF